MYNVNEMKLFGSRLSVCRQNRNMTQEELACRLGITAQALSKWERGVGLPDVSMLADLAGLLEVSTDYLLGIGHGGSPEGDRESMRLQEEIGGFLMAGLDSLQLQFGTKIVPFLVDNRFVEKIVTLRRKMAEEGYLLPIVRIRDNNLLEEQEFMITAHNNVLYSEQLEALDENTVDRMIGKLCECVRKNYHEILSPDLMKSYVDFLRGKYPALLDGVVPERIPYSLLTETVRQVVRCGDSIIYLPICIEVMDCALRDAPRLSARELADRIRKVIEREDNVDIVLGKRRESRKP